MRIVTELAVRRRTVTLLGIVLALIAGIFTYRNLPVELFPEIEFPLVTVTAFYPSANPDAVVREVTAPIEGAISGVDGLETIQSISSENRSIVLASFKFGTDMEEAESTITSNLNSVRLPATVETPRASRISPDSFPVLQFSIIGDRDIEELQQILESSILPAISSVEGVFRVEVAGEVESRVLVTVDPEKLLRSGISLFQVSQALSDNSITLPAGTITGQGQTFPIKATNSYRSLDDLRDLVVGMPLGAQGPAADRPSGPPAPVRLGDVAEVTLGTATATSISRTNGRPSVGLGVIKDPDANTIDVTSAVLEALDGVALPSDVEIVTVSNDGPAIQGQINTLQREGMFGFIFAITVVFLFMVTLRPTVPRGLFNTLRPTVVIALSIPLSIFTGVLLMDWQGLSLNFMTLGGLAISVGRVVDDSIVVLENVYRHIQGGRERWRAAVQATVEVGPAITASTLTTIVVFAPLAFIQGLVGAFFFPFALAVCFALIASLAVALTAVPVLGAYILRPGGLPEGAGEEDEIVERETWMQRAYEPVLRWSLRHKAITLVTAVVLTVGSLGLMAFIPVNLFSSGGDRFLQIDMTMPPGTAADRTVEEAASIEAEIEDITDVYLTTIGSPAASFGGGGPSGFNQGSIFLQLKEDAGSDIAADLRQELGGVPGRTVNITEVVEGPPQGGLEIRVTGNNYDDIASATEELVAELGTIDGVVNVSSDISEARDEIVIDVDPGKAGAVGLSAQTVAFQVSQFLVGRSVAEVEIDGDKIDVVLTGRSDDITDVDSVRGMMIAGPMGAAPLADLAEVTIQKAPVSVSRTDGLRSATISGSITSEDTQAVGILVQETIDELILPPGVEVESGGVFAQIAEGFQGIFLAMGVGVVLVYLVMVVSLGSLRNPFVIVTSLPLALIGALAALAVTGRSMGLPAMMGILLLIGIVVTNAIVLIAFVEQLREKGLSVYDALIQGGRVRLRPILMTALTTSFALLPLAAFVSSEGGILSAELATVVIGGLMSSTVLTLVVVPVVYTLANESIPGLLRRIFGNRALRQVAELA